MPNRILRRLRSRRGATVVEYIVMVGLVSVIAMATLTTVGSNGNSLFTDVSESIDGVITGSTGTGSDDPGASGAPTTPETPPTPDQCLTLGAGGGQQASSHPGETCFEFTAGMGDTFTFAVDERIIYVDGLTLSPVNPIVIGNSQDNNLGVLNEDTSVSFDGDGGTDRIFATDSPSTDAYFEFDPGDGTYYMDIFDGSDTFSSSFVTTVDFTGVEFVVFSDITLSIGQIDACIADNSCVFVGGGPGGPGGPGGLAEPPFVSRDGCVVEDATGSYEWCPGPNPQDPLPSPLIFQTRLGDQCAFDPTFEGGQYVTEFWDPFTGGLDPGSNSGLACY
ncbi:MAG: hypothetical protein Alpg2KO_29640 [Alphaproteobacteria bacterium]